MTALGVAVRREPVAVASCKRGLGTSGSTRQCCTSTSPRTIAGTFRRQSSIIAASAGEHDPDRRIIATLDARGSVVAAWWQRGGSGCRWIQRKGCDYNRLSGAGEGIRTLDVNLGKVALYH
jgi:hypothetical protein